MKKKAISKRRSLLLAPFLILLFVSTGFAKVLPVPETFQKQSQWCWDASSQAVLKYYGTSVTQCEIANYAFGETTCCINVVWPDGTGPKCNKPWYLYGKHGSVKDNLLHYGKIESEGSSSALSKDTCTSEINQERPWVMRWGWKAGGGHILVGRGIEGNTVYYMDPWPGEGYKTADYTAVVGSSTHTWTHSLKIKTKGIVFCIDDTGSMMEEIAWAKAAAIKVLDDNKAAGRKCYYTLLTFKDGPATLRGQSSDEDTMKGYINALYASGGWGCPESSLTAIRQGADLSQGADIFMMTDASSNSYGVDNTYAGWGEVFETIYKLLENKCHLHSIIYSTCFGSYSSGDGDGELQCPGCYYDGLDIFSLGSEDPSGEDGYNRASTETGGLYFRISSADTEKAVEVILREASSDSTVCYYDGSLSGGDTTYIVPVDDTITQLQVVLNGNVGSSVSLEVKNPAGEIVDNDTAGVSIILVGGSTFYLIEETAIGSAGDWTAKVSGNGSYRFSASCSTTNPMDYTGDTSVGVGGTLSLKADFMEEVGNIGFQIVKLDGSSPVEITLYDDGKHNDGAAGDLTYGGIHVMDTVGSYRFRATGDGNYQRMYSSKITVGNLDVVAPSPKNVAPGTSLTHQFQVKNLGTEEDTYDLFASSSLGWCDLTGIPSSVTILAGGIEYIDIPVAVPAGATTGQVDVLSVQAVSQANSLINDTDETETRVGTIYDFDGNGVVDVVDIMKVASRWNTAAGDPDYDATYDLDGDGDIDIIDIMMVAAQWGWTT